jgi:hypothetical protein
LAAVIDDGAPISTVVLEVAMTGLAHKTTVLLSKTLHRQLRQLAVERGQSLGELVREACERQYGITDRQARLAAVEALGALRLPVGPVEQMIAESVPARGICRTDHDRRQHLHLRGWRRASALEQGTTPEIEQRIAAAPALVTSRLALVESARALLRVRVAGGVPESRLADAQRELDVL